MACSLRQWAILDSAYTQTWPYRFGFFAGIKKGQQMLTFSMSS